MNKNEIIKKLDRDITDAEKSVQSSLDYIKRSIKNVEDRLNSDRMSFNIFGEFQGSIVSVEVEIARLDEKIKLRNELYGTLKN